MLGTSTTSVTCSSCRVRSTLSGRNAGSSTLVEPVTICDIRRPRPATWNNGATNKATPSAGLGTSAIRATEETQKLACESITPFGVPVVPPVYRIAASASPPAR